MRAFADHGCANVEVLYRYAGGDASRAYAEVHQPALLREYLPRECFVGRLDASTVDEKWMAAGAARAETPALAGNADETPPPLHMVLNR